MSKYAQVHMQDQITNRVQEIMSWHWQQRAKPHSLRGISLLFTVPLIVTLWQYL